MIFRWLRQRRRRQLTDRAFPENWQRIIADNVRHVQCLSASQHRRLRNQVQIFVAEKQWEGCNGFVITDEVKVTTAAQACLLLMREEGDYCFDQVLSVLVYPDAYVAQEMEESAGGVMSEQGESRLGETIWQGPVVLSWPDVLAGGRGSDSGGNLVLHEFAHQLDMRNGRFVDGVPPIESKAALDQWLTIMQVEFQRLIARCRSRQPGVISCYGTTNEAEFFSVVTEAFFERSVQLRRHHAQLYALLRDYYQLDPAEWQRQ